MITDMLKNKLYFLTTCFVLISTVQATHAQEFAVKWPAKEMSTVDAVMATAQVHRGFIMLEAWDDQSFIKQVEYHPVFVVPGEIINAYADEVVPNPARIVIPKPQTDLNAARAIDHIVSVNKKLNLKQANSF